MIRYQIRPGYVQSVNDGDTHYVGAAQLAKLYGLRPGEWVVDTGRLRGSVRSDLPILSPCRTIAQYNRIAERIRAERESAVKPTPPVAVLGGDPKLAESPTEPT